MLPFWGLCAWCWRLVVGNSAPGHLVQLVAMQVGIPPHHFTDSAPGHVVQLVAVQVVIPPDRLTDSTPGHVVQLVAVQVAVQVAIPPVSLTVNQSCIG